MRNPILAFFIAITLAAPLLAGEPKELQAARSKYQQASPHPGEAERERYITSLARMRGELSKNRSSMDWQAVDAEIRRHPLPKDADSKALSQVLIGKWSSPRHDYVFRQDGTWSMLPAENDATRGGWRIQGNRFIDTVGQSPSDARSYTIILLNQKDFIYTDGEVVFYETRKGK